MISSHFLQISLISGYVLAMKEHETQIGKKGQKSSVVNQNCLSFPYDRHPTNEEQTKIIIKKSLKSHDIPTELLNIRI